MPSLNGSYAAVKLSHVMQSIISHLTLKQLCHAICYPFKNATNMTCLCVNRIPNKMTQFFYLRLYGLKPIFFQI